MAYQDQFYTVGTVTVMNGSTEVVGAGTGWETALIVGGVFYAGGGAYPIQSVSSETELTLAIPYAGVDAAAVGYAIDRQRAAAISNIAMNDRLAQIIREISIGNIEVINSLDSVDNLASLAEIALLANKLLGTDATKSLVQIDFGALGKAILALDAGTNAQYVRADGQLATLNKVAVGLGNVDNTSDAAKPISAATQSALNAKLSLTGGNLSGPIATLSTVELRSVIPKIYMISPSSIYGYRMEANISDAVNGTWRVAAGYNGAALFQVGMDGSAIVSGTLTAGSKSFITDHPLDPLNADLVYASTESPSHGIEYWGTVRLVDGRAIVDVDGRYGMRPGTFQAMTKDKVLFFQNQDSGKSVYRRWLDDGTFEIICDDETCNDLIGWQVKGERQDAVVFTLPHTDSQTGRLIPEQEKPDFVEVEHV
ncbi:hypothetical protein [Brucella intermedia]|uniref:hypothetical protein n=1 Tax=Brucella intermedia TaxID=94625 RepID=UPI00124CD83B|nr:hypothetical protein [Brucella intermedia]KAB2730743.1 hypothetical protein F9L02_11885 [Brucella intermedia]